jgi:hypothetical protein
LTKHFNSCSTYNFTQKGQIQSILTKGQNGIFKHVHKKYPNLFWYGAFASLDKFIGSCLNPAKNPQRQLRQLFMVNQSQMFSCPLGHDQPNCPRNRREIFVLSIRRAMFLENNLSIHDVAGLVKKWTDGTGLTGHPGLICQTCKQLNRQEEPSVSSDKSSSNNESLEIISKLSNKTPGVPLKVSRISFGCNGPPLHRYFTINDASINDEENQRNSLGQMDWPFKLNFGGHVHTLFTRGFWGHSNYWSHLLKNSNGAVEVWKQDDQENKGNAQLISHLPGKIGGKLANTNSLFYLRKWTPEKATTVNGAIEKI